MLLITPRGHNGNSRSRSVYLAHDLANEHKDKVQAMFQKLVAWLQDTDARMPFLNPKYDKELYRKQQIQTRTKALPALERGHAAVLRPDYVPRGGWWEGRDK